MNRPDFIWLILFERYPMTAFLILLQILTFIGIGFLIRRTNLVTDKFRLDLSRLIMYVSLPAFLINSMNFSYSKELMRSSLDMVLLSFAPYAIILGLSSLFGRTRLLTEDEMAPYRFIMSFSNVGFLGYPVVAALFGVEAVFLAAMFNLIFDVLQWTYGVHIFKKDEKINIRHFLNPAIIAILIGFSMFILNVDFPAEIQTLIATLGATATPLAMITTGLIIAEFDLSNFFIDIKPLFVSIYRLLLLPFLLLLILSAAGVRGLPLVIPVVIIGMPGSASGPIIASNYGGNYELTSRLQCITTILSIITIPILDVITKWALQSL